MKSSFQLMGRSIGCGAPSIEKAMYCTSSYNLGAINGPQVDFPQAIQGTWRAMGRCDGQTPKLWGSPEGAGSRNRASQPKGSQQSIQRVTQADPTTRKDHGKVQITPPSTAVPICPRRSQKCLPPAPPHLFSRFLPPGQRRCSLDLGRYHA